MLTINLGTYIQRCSILLAQLPQCSDKRERKAPTIEAMGLVLVFTSIKRGFVEGWPTTVRATVESNPWCFLSAKEKHSYRSKK
jgi:hypothetical protein